MKRRDVLILIAIWDFLTALGAFVIIAVVSAIVFSVFTQSSDVVRTFMLIAWAVAVIFLLAYLGLSVAAGIGLMKEREWGRILAIIHAALSLFRMPVGTVLGVLTIIYLLSPETKGYFKTSPQ